MKRASFWPIAIGGGIALVLLGKKAKASPRKAPTVAASSIYRKSLYVPGSPEAVLLFTSAAKYAQLPVEWASAPGLHGILSKESGGYVGRPNYQFGELAKLDRAAEWPRIWQAIADGSWRSLLEGQVSEKTAARIDVPYRAGLRFKDLPQGKQSSASGLGQLTSTNIKTGKYYPSGLAGIGNALEEAIGMLKYIKDRYGDPAYAWAQYGVGKEGY